MKYFWILIALLALSFAVSAQSDRVKTVETRDSASLVIFDTTGTEYNGVSVQEALEELDFDAGNILYVATTGNDATGVVGYPNKPFIPSYSLSDNTSNIAHWYYPGVYTIGPGQEYPFTFGNQQNPYILYAPNSDLNFINNTNGYLFRPSGSHTNPYFYVLVKKLYLQDLSFIRFFEVNNSGDFFADIKQLVLADSIAGGDAGFVIPSGQINIDSFYVSSRAGIYSTSRNGNKIDFNIGYFESNQVTTIDGNKAELIRQGDAFAGPQDSTMLNISIDNLYATDVARVFSNAHNGQYQNTLLNLTIDNCFVFFTGSTVDSTITEQSAGLTTSNNLNFIGLYASDYSDYTANLNLENIQSDKYIYVADNGPNSLININIGNAKFQNSRAIQFSNPDPVGSISNLSCGRCISDVNAPVTVYGSNGTINIRGRYETEKANRPVIYTQKDLFLEDCYLINDGTYPAIEASTAVTIYVSGNLYMNSDSIHPNVTFVKLDYGYTNPINAEFESTQIILDSLYSKAVGTSTYTAGGALSIGLTDIKITGLTPGIEEKFSVTDSTITYLGDTAYLAVEYSGTVELSPVALGTYLVEFTPYHNATALQYAGSDAQIRVDASEQWFLPFGNKAVVQAVPGDEFSIRYRGTAGTPSNLRNLSFTVFRL